MALDKEKTNKNELALPAEQTEACLEHQCSKSYLFSMLQDSPEPKYQYSKPLKPSTSQVVSRPLNSVLMGLSGDGKRVLIMPSNITHKIVSTPPASSSQEGTKVANSIVVQRKRPLDKADCFDAIKLHKEDGSEVMSKKERDTEMGPRCNCKLSIISKKFHCNDFTEAERKSLFTDFWKNNDWQQRKTLVCSLVKCGIPNARRRECTDPSRKEFAFQYNLKKNGQLLRVCKVMFLTTLSVGDGTVRDWVMSGMSKQPFVNL